MPGYNRRRLGGNLRGNYAAAMGLHAVAFSRKRKRAASYPPSAAPRLGRRVRARPASSFTSTKTRRKRRSSGVVKQSENGSASFVKYGSSKIGRVNKQLYKKLLGRRIDYYNGMFTGTSGTGRQYVQLLTFGTHTQISSIKTALNGGASTQLPLKMHIGYMKWVISLKNQSNFVGKCTLYDIVLKRMPYNDALDDPSELWRKGMTDFSAGVDQTNYPGNTPFRSPEFRRWCRVVKVTSLNIEPGQQHDHQVVRKHNRVYDTASWDHSLVFTPVAMFTLIVWHGSIVSGSNSTVLSPQVSYCPMQIDGLWRMEVTSSMLPGTAPQYARITDAIPVALTSAQAMGQNSDAAMANVDVPGGV